MHKKSESEKQEKDKGLKFKGFPHKKILTPNSNPGNSQAPKQKIHAGLISQGPLINEKGQSRSKSKKSEMLK